MNKCYGETPIMYRTNKMGGNKFGKTNFMLEQGPMTKVKSMPNAMSNGLGEVPGTNRSGSMGRKMY